MADGEGRVAAKTGAHIVADVVKPLAREAESVGEHGAEHAATTAASKDAERSAAKAIDPFEHLGPTTIDHAKPGGEFIPEDYDRFAGSSGPDDFVDQHWDPDSYSSYNNTTGGWYYPDDEGFTGPTLRNAEPPVGTEMDRFGENFGDFTAVPGTSFQKRALPPSSLAENYHRYRLIKPFDGESGYPRFGRTAPAFGQPGGGMQYKLPQKIAWLEQHGYLKDVTP